MLNSFEFGMERDTPLAKPNAGQSITQELALMSDRDPDAAKVVTGRIVDSCTWEQVS